MTDRKDLLKQLSIDRDLPPERKVPWGWIITVAALLGLGFGLFALLNKGSSELVVKTAVARAASTGGGNASQLDASGYVVARRQATVSSKVTGKVESVLIEEGMRVEKDQLLATLEPIDSQKQLDLTQAQARAADAQLGDLRVQIRDAERQLKRQQELVAKKLVAQVSLDSAETLVSSLKARLNSAARSLDVSRTSVAVSQQNLDNTKVYAPFAGVVIARSAQVGEIVSPLSAGGGFTRTGIGTIVDMDSLEVEVDVNEAFLQKVVANAPTLITLNAYPDWKIAGHVIAIIPTADRSKATVKVRVAFGEKDARVLPDMGARVAFLSAAETAVGAPPVAKNSGVLIPANAVLGGDTVFVLKDGVIARRAVTSSGTGSELTVTSGLAAGETVVLEPQSGWQDGARVRVQ
jgi:RND family efflux transporter MFP subunit